MPKESAVEMLVYQPELPVPPEERGVYENLWIKQCFNLDSAVDFNCGI